MNIPQHKIACISKMLCQAILIIAITKKVFHMHQRSSEFRFLVNRMTKLTVTDADIIESLMEAYSV